MIAGTSAIDASLLTGESVPVEVAPGDSVTGATINTSGSLLVRATRVGEDTQLAQMGRLLTQAQTGKANVQRLADKISSIFVPCVILISLLTFAAWLAFGSTFEAALIPAITVLVVACPCALGLATPTALLVGSGAASRSGILISGPEVLERAHAINTIVLDKTGTLTTGEMQVSSIRWLSTQQNLPRDLVLQIAASLEAHSSHPIAQAIVRYVDQTLPPPAARPIITEVDSGSGLGVHGFYEPTQGLDFPSERAEKLPIAIGNIDWLAKFIATDFREIRILTEEINIKAGATAVVCTFANEPIAIFSVKDTLRPETPQLLADLKAQKIEPIMISGDAPEIAAAVGAELKIQAQGGVRPEGKVAVVKALQAAGKSVGMFGDGVNDGPALAAADLSIAVGSGSDVAKAAADITVLSGLPAVTKAIQISRRTLRIIRENLAWAFGYNLLAIPLAIFGVIIPGIAAAAMAASSVIVVANSLRLYRD
ncbi:heavy metal translocating P-type ATPase [Arcanobacterium hippocoleae]|uniref:heavy metal translocating P-type ATPase n=1 Tax=Arcanobacterium hippocoleae TaxID=149017 RepID=UPI00333F179D